MAAPTLKQAKTSLANMDPLLKKAGAVGVSASQKAFSDQAFDGEPWTSRYPNQNEPKINVAGALNDFNRGQFPLSRRFKDSPVGKDSGALRASLSFRVRGNSVDVGSALPYASTFQVGGKGRRPIKVTTTATKTIAKFLKKNRRFSDKLGFLFQTERLETSQVGRQFVGLTDTLLADMVELTKRHFQKGVA